MPTTDEILDWIANESAAVAATIRPDTVDRPVPSCPEWQLRDLVGHLARVQSFWARVIRAGTDVQPEFPDAGASSPQHADEVRAYMQAATHDLIQALRDTAWDSPAWVWWKEPRTVGAIGRHQAQEAAVHRWDAQLAVGTPDPLPTALADDGVDEFVHIAGQMRGPVPIRLRATDTGREVLLSTDAPAVTVAATASDLVLLLYGRVSARDVGVDGDASWLDRFLMPID
jgi:uncharacterized protein (TIGR03083 family)